MVMSRFLLRTRYSARQYIGAAMVMAGLVTVLAPTLLSGQQTSAPTIAPTGNTTFRDSNTTAPTASPSASPMGDVTSTVVWSSVMVLSCIPMTLSSVYSPARPCRICIGTGLAAALPGTGLFSYKEKSLDDAYGEINAIYMQVRRACRTRSCPLCTARPAPTTFNGRWLAQGWVALFQLFFAIPFAFPAAIVGGQISSVQQARVARLSAVGMSVAGASLVPVQMWEGRAQSWCRCGRGEPSLRAGSTMAVLAAVHLGYECGLRLDVP